MTTDQRPRQTLKYRGEKITHTPGFALSYGWLGTLWFATLEECKQSIDNAAWNQR